MNKKLVTLFTWLAFFTFPVATFAVGGFMGNQFPTITSLNIPNFLTILFSVVIWPSTIAIIIVMFIYAGVMFLMAKGDAAKLQSAKSSVIWGLAGVAVIVLSFSVITIVKMLLS